MYEFDFEAPLSPHRLPAGRVGHHAEDHRHRRCRGDSLGNHSGRHAPLALPLSPGFAKAYVIRFPFHPVGDGLAVVLSDCVPGCKTCWDYRRKPISASISAMVAFFYV